MHKYRRRYLLVELKGKLDLKTVLQSSPVRVKLVKEEDGYALLKADSNTIDSLKQFIIENSIKTIATSGTMKGLFRHKRLNHSSAFIESG